MTIIAEVSIEFLTLRHVELFAHADSHCLRTLC